MADAARGKEPARSTGLARTGSGGHRSSVFEGGLQRQSTILEKCPARVAIRRHSGRLRRRPQRQVKWPPAGPNAAPQWDSRLLWPNSLAEIAGHAEGGGNSRGPLGCRCGGPTTWCRPHPSSALLHARRGLARPAHSWNHWTWLFELLDFDTLGTRPAICVRIEEGWPCRMGPAHFEHTSCQDGVTSVTGSWAPVGPAASHRTPNQAAYGAGTVMGIERLFK